MRSLGGWQQLKLLKMKPAGKTDVHISQLEVSGPVTSVLLFQSSGEAAWAKHQSCCKSEIPGTAQGPCQRNSPCTAAASTDTHKSCSPDPHWELIPSLGSSEMGELQGRSMGSGWVALTNPLPNPAQFPRACWVHHPHGTGPDCCSAPFQIQS